MLKASFSLIRSPKTLHLVNPVDPCGFSRQVKADDLSPHLMVYAKAVKDTKPLTLLRTIWSVEATKIQVYYQCQYTFKIRETQVLYHVQFFSLIRFKYLGDLFFPTI